jgi:linoleoyl-CoA desaturase
LAKSTVRFNAADLAEFWPDLRQRVNTYFAENNLDKQGDHRLYIKTGVMISVFLSGVVMLYLAPTTPGWIILAYTIIGLGQAGTGLSVMHDALHGSYSGHKWLNRLMQYSMPLIGGNRTTWKIQHNVNHHTYTNIYRLDEDIDDKPFLRLSPHGEWKPYHRFQHIYAWGLYCFAVLAWLYRKDFAQLSNYRKASMPARLGYNHIKVLWRMIIAKALFISFLLILPVVNGMPLGWAVTGFILSHMLSGLLISVIFQLAHVVESTEHDHIPSSGQMQHSWAVQQLRTTANFAVNNPWVTWLTGGLNHQVEHHLFPTISHVHYPAISCIVRETASQYGLPYHHNEGFWKAVASHTRTLRKFGNAVPVAAQ